MALMAEFPLGGQILIKNEMLLQSQNAAGVTIKKFYIHWQHINAWIVSQVDSFIQ